MPTETFQASRWTSGNHLFPTIIEVSDKAVVRHKRSWFSKDEISISITKVASVHIKTGIFWSQILIESSGAATRLPVMAIERRTHNASARLSRKRKEFLPWTKSNCPDRFVFSRSLQAVSLRTSWPTVCLFTKLSAK